MGFARTADGHDHRQGAAFARNVTPRGESRARTAWTAHVRTHSNSVNIRTAVIVIHCRSNFFSAARQQISRRGGGARLERQGRHAPDNRRRAGPRASGESMPGQLKNAELGTLLK